MEARRPAAERGGSGFFSDVGGGKEMREIEVSERCTAHHLIRMGQARSGEIIQRERMSG